LINIPDETVERAILVIRSQRVILDHALARMYGVSTKDMIQAVKRNPERFPADYMFQLTREEAKKSCGKTTKYRPYAFTEYGVLMLSGVLRSECAIEVSIQIVDKFVRLRELVASNSELTKRVEDLERACDGTFQIVFETIKKLTRSKVRKRKPIGFLSSRTRKR
jgi:phage regulator Rha-like protein